VTVLALPAGARSARLQAFLANRFAAGAGIICILFCVVALAAPALAPHDPYDSDLLRRLQPPGWMPGGDWAFPLGCDSLGRDLLARMIYGARISIGVGVAVVGIATVIGLALGLAAGYLRGITDTIISCLVDILLGFPSLILAIGLMAMMGPGLSNIVLALAYKEWVVPCRIARAETLAAREREYIEAAHALGASRWHIMASEILPNVLSPVLVVAPYRMAFVIIAEASLSFLGLGVQPPMASWGSMVADGRSFLIGAWWISTFPGLAILALTLCLNVASQGLREAFDPRLLR